MKVVVTNAVITNTGDAAILAGIRSSLIEQGVCAADEITVLDSNAAVTRRLYPHLRILQQLTVQPPGRGRLRRAVTSRLRRWTARRLLEGSSAVRTVMRSAPAAWSEYGRAYRAVLEADCVVSTGGTYLVDHYDFRARALELEIAKDAGKPVILWTQSMGPFEAPRARRAIASIIRNADQPFFRDDRSRGYWNARGGAAGPETVCPDVAFALVPASPGPDAPSARVLLSVREWDRPGPNALPVAREAYESSMLEAARRVREHGLAPLALSTCQGVRGYHDDAGYAAELFAPLEVPVDRDFHTPHELIQEIQDARLVITTRMHFAILSLLSGRPTIAIAYEFKTLELFESLGLSRYVISIEDVSPEWIGEAVRAALGDASSATLAPAERRRLRERAMRPALSLVGSEPER